MNDNDEVAGAVDTLLASLEADDRVDHASVGGVVRDRSEVVLTAVETRTAHQFTDAGVWCRVLAEGASAYRHVGTLDEDALVEEGKKTVRSAVQLGQDEPERYDPETLHRATHGGWGDEECRRLSLDEQRGRLLEVRDEVLGGSDLERLRLKYINEAITSMLATTSGTTITTHLDRESTDLSLDAGGGPVRRRHGSTDGTTIRDTEELLIEALRDARRLAAHDPVDADLVTGADRNVVLSPLAAGQLAHLVSRAFEADVALAGLSPFELGDRIADSALTITDGVRAGSFAARAYDAEGRPTTPVQLVEDGIARNWLHSVSSAAAMDGDAAGNVVSSIGFERAPRIHARHLDVEGDDATRADLLDGADIYVERFHSPWKRKSLIRKLRSGWAPPGARYTPQLAERIDEETRRDAAGDAMLSVAEGFSVEKGALNGRLSNVSYAFDFADLRSIDGIGTRRPTTVGVDEQHKSRIPYAVTAPAIRLSGRIE